MLEARDIAIIGLTNVATLMVAAFIFRISLENRLTKLETLIDIFAKKFGIQLNED